MNPISARAVEEPGRVNRNVLCEHYEDCLDVTLSRDWPGFSCESCGSFSPAQKSPLAWYEDAQSCADLIEVVFGWWIVP